MELKALIPNTQTQPANSPFMIQQPHKENTLNLLQWLTNASDNVRILAVLYTLKWSKQQMKAFDLWCCWLDIRNIWSAKICSTNHKKFAYVRPGLNGLQSAKTNQSRIENRRTEEWSVGIITVDSSTRLLMQTTSGSPISYFKNTVETYITATSIVDGGFLNGPKNTVFSGDELTMLSNCSITES